MSKRAKDNYENFKKEKIIKIGVIGNSNKGKSFLLSKISKINFPSGTSINTEGLSVKYPELDLYKDRRIALLDSAGLETPVLKENENEKEKEKTETNEKEENCELETVKENETQNEEKNENELFKEKSREKLLTELFLQNYIINNSNILIIVVGILTYSEQKLLNRIKNEMQRSKINKPLFIIHNLITYTSIPQIKDYIENNLLKSATFDLEEGHKISTKLETKSGIYYFEKNTEPKIYHLIFANEGSEAGKYYNQFTLDFLENNYVNITKPFDVIETIKDRFSKISQDFILTTDEIISKESFDDSNPELIKLKDEKEIILKISFPDELGSSNRFEPAYNLFKKEDKFIVRVEVPGNCIIESKIEFAGEYNIIILSGKKKKDKEPYHEFYNIFNTRKYGDFSLEIPLKTEDYLLCNEPPKIENRKGVFIIIYNLSKKVNRLEYIYDEEEEI